MILLPAPTSTRSPFRRQAVLYVGVYDVRTVLASATIPLARCEDGIRAVCLTRCFRRAMDFANRHSDIGGVLALDRDRLRARHRITTHRDTVWTLRTRAAGYDEHEERVLSPITAIAPLLLGAWESSVTTALRANLAAYAPTGFLDGPDVDWLALMDEDDLEAA